jgi:hypothetical protein
MGGRSRFVAFGREIDLRKIKSTNEGKGIAICRKDEKE